MPDRNLYVAGVMIEKGNGYVNNTHAWIVADNIAQAESHAIVLAEQFEQKPNVERVSIISLALKQPVWIAPVQE